MTTYGHLVKTDNKNTEIVIVITRPIRNQIPIQQSSCPEEQAILSQQNAPETSPAQLHCPTSLLQLLQVSPRIKSPKCHNCELNSSTLVRWQFHQWSFKIISISLKTQSAEAVWRLVNNPHWQNYYTQNYASLTLYYHYKQSNTTVGRTNTAMYAILDFQTYESV